METWQLTTARFTALHDGIFTEAAAFAEHSWLEWNAIGFTDTEFWWRRTETRDGDRWEMWGADGEQMWDSGVTAAPAVDAPADAARGEWTTRESAGAA